MIELKYIVFSLILAIIFAYLPENNYICAKVNEIYVTMNDLNRIKVVLVEQKKTSKWLADQLGKNPATVSKWCTNTSQPDLATLNQIAALLEVKVSQLLVENTL